MARLKLIMGLSYTGEVKATRENPYVEVETEAEADNLVASGYFERVDSEKKPEKKEDPEKKETEKKEEEKEEAATPAPKKTTAKAKK